MGNKAQTLVTSNVIENIYKEIRELVEDKKKYIK